MTGLEELFREQKKEARERRLRRIENLRARGLATWDDEAQAYELRRQIANEAFEEREQQEAVRRAVREVHEIAATVLAS